MNNSGSRYSSRSNHSSKDSSRYYYSRSNSSMNNNGRRNSHWYYYSSKDRSKYNHSKRTFYSSHICRINYSFFWRSSTIWKSYICRYANMILAWIRFRNSKIQDRNKYRIYGLEWISIFDSWWNNNRINSTNRNILRKNSNIFK